MRRSDPPPLTRGVVLRGLGVLVAIGLGAVGIWMIANGDGNAKQVQIGAFAEFWALLIGAFAIFGSRRMDAEDAAAAAAAAAGAGMPGTALELRGQSYEVERAEEAAARRAHEERLEHILRREIQSSVAREVTSLRDEIAQLRSELLEKVGGQLQLERIETTRLIGSDLEALQRELRDLKHAAHETTSFSRIVEPARVRPVSRETADVEADVRPAVQVVRQRPEPVPVEPAPPEPAPARAPAPVAPAPVAPVAAVPVAAAPAPPPPVAPAPTPVMAQPEPPVASPEAVVVRPEPPVARPEPVAARPEPPVARPEPVAARPEPPVARPEPPRPAPEPRLETKPAAPLPTAGIPAAPAPAEPRPAPLLGADPFAGLPRIRPFTDFELDPIDDEPGPYTGRRRRTEEEGARGRHSGDGVDEPPAGRRRAPESGDELLARLLARENARH